MKQPVPLRLAMVAPCLFPSPRGSQALIYELARRLAEEGHIVHLVTYPGVEPANDPVGVQVHRVHRFAGLWTTRPLGWQKLPLDVLLAWVLLRVVRREGIQVIHAHNLEGPLVAWGVRLLTGVPVVYHAHNAMLDELPSYVRGHRMRRLAAVFGAMLDRCVVGAADYSIALSDRLAAFLAARGAAGRVAVVPPAVRVRPAAKASCHGCRDTVTLMYAGNLDPYQDLDVLIRGFRRVRRVVPAARLILVTHVPDVARIAGGEDLRRAPGVEVRVVPDFASALTILRDADTLVCPRSSWSGFPIKAVNYMGLGLPIVQARGSAHGLRHEESCLIFENGSAEGLANAVLRVLSEPALAVRIGRGARALAIERHRWEKVMPAIENIYWGLLEGRDMGEDGEKRWMRQALTERLMIGKGRTIKRNGKHGGRVSVARRLSVLTIMVLSIGVWGCFGQRRAPLAPLPPIAQQQPLPEVITPEYRLLPGDILRVKFRYHPSLDLKLPVRPDGTVALSGVGSFPAQGKTAEELARAIEAKASEWLREPWVTVVVAQIGAHKIYVGGEVRSPGFVFYRDGMSPLQAILERGGFTDVARIDSVLKVSGPDATRLDLSKTVIGGKPELSSLAVNDVLYVPRTFIGDANEFVRLYILNVLPIVPRAGVGFSP